MDRRMFLSFLAAGAGLSAPSAALAQADYPARPVRIIVPFTPGGSSDLLARVVAKGLSERWKQSVFVENLPGGSGIVGTDRAAKSAPDGYTMLFGTISNLGVNPTLFEGKLPYDPLTSFVPVTLAASIPLLLVVSQSLGVNSLAELVALAKGRSDLNYGSGGNGSSQHLAMELFKQSAGLPMTHVPYKSSAPAMTDLVSGHIHLMFDNLNTALPHVESGKLKAIAVTSAARPAQAPNMQTMAEAGYPAVQIGTWFAFLAPAGTPADIVRKMNADTVAVLTDTDTKAQLAAQGMEVIASSADALTAHMKAEIAKWGDVVRKGGIRAD